MLRKSPPRRAKRCHRKPVVSETPGSSNPGPIAGSAGLPILMPFPETIPVCEGAMRRNRSRLCTIFQFLACNATANWRLFFAVCCDLFANLHEGALVTHVVSLLGPVTAIAAHGIFFSTFPLSEMMAKTTALVFLRTLHRLMPGR